MKFQPQLKISVVIPVYNGGEAFRQCLASLAQTTVQPYEIIVVADGDTDDSWLAAKEFGATVIRHDTPQGPAVARNLGARVATGDIIFFVDADVTIQPDTIARVEAIFQEEPYLGAAIGSYDDAPGQKNFLSQYRNLLHHYVHQTSSEEASTFWGACGAIRRDVFLTTGGFDEGYAKPCIEDIEFGHRIRQAGYHIRLNKDLQVKHLKRWEPLSMVKTDFFCRALPWTQIILRDRQLKNDLNFKVSHRMSALLAYALPLMLLIALWWQPAGIIAMILGGIFYALNASLYEFFQEKRGTAFAMQVIPWHWLYYVYSSLAFAIGSIQYIYSHHGQMFGGMKRLLVGLRWSFSREG